MAELPVPTPEGHQYGSVNRGSSAWAHLPRAQAMVEDSARRGEDPLPWIVEQAFRRLEELEQRIAQLEGG